MIPLRTTEPVTRFPRATVGLIALWIVADAVSRLWPGARADFLMHFAFVPVHPRFEAAAAWLFHANFFSLFVSIVFAWAFTPRLFERSGLLFASLAGFSGVALALASYRALHPHALAPVLAPEAFLGALLGAFMRRDIWGSVDTLVIGPGWIRLFEVPSYVLLFFWFFYLLIGNLLTSAPFSDAPLLYWIPFISFLWGFVLESVWAILMKPWMSSSSSNKKSAASKS